MREYLGKLAPQPEDKRARLHVGEVGWQEHHGHDIGRVEVLLEDIAAVYFSR